MKAWRQDVENVLMMAGIDNKGVTFLFADTMIINEQMLEDINSILNSGDAPNLNLYSSNFDIIKNECQDECIKKGFEPSKMNIFREYLNRVKKNLHVIVIMSPV
jgi:dynein heavy chain